MNEFFTQRSAADHGTLYNIKNVFGHRSVKKAVMNSFNFVADLIAFTTESMVCLLALKSKKKVK